MTDLPTVRDWLGSLDEDGLEALLAHCPWVLAGAHPRSLDELTMRLQHPAMVTQSILTAPTPLLEVTEAATALGGSATCAALVRLLSGAGAGGEEEHDRNVRHWIDVAGRYALLWRDGEEHIRVNPGLDEVLLAPLALARPSRRPLAEATSDDLARHLRAWRIPCPARKADRLALVEGVFADPQALRRITAGADDRVLSSLTDHVTKTLARARTVSMQALAPLPDEDDDFLLYQGPEAYRADRDLWMWAHAAGLAFGTTGWGAFYDAELPSEVYLALAPADFRLPFHPAPPPLSTMPVPPDQATRSSAAAIAQFLGTAMAVLEAVASGGIKPLKAGGIGARELSRYAKRMSSDVTTIRLILVLAGECGLLEFTGGAEVRTSERFERWRREAPAQRALELIEAWLDLDLPPTLERDEDGTYLPALGRGPQTAGMPLGLVLCRLLAQFPGRGALSADGLADYLAWHHPVGATVPGGVGAAWLEGHSLGVLVEGALSSFADAIGSEEQQRALSLLEDLLPTQSTEVLFGSDLTILAPGSPLPRIVDVLDVVARREGHGVANTWRVSEQTVRSALDAGYEADDLIAALSEMAPLPQTLEYLLRDVARKHGRVAVRPAGCVLVSSDEALLAEVVATRKLRPLGLSLPAPTVAVSTASPDRVLDQLRSAGYAPIELGDDGAPAVELRRVPGSSPTADGDTRSGPVDTSEEVGEIGDVMNELDDAEIERFLDPFLTEMSGWPDREDRETPSEAAHRLLSAGEELVPSELEHAIAFEARRLNPVEVHELAEAILNERPVWIRYRSQSGGESSRTVSQLQVQGAHLYCYCHMRDAERVFRLGRLLAVAPVLL